MKHIAAGHAACFGGGTVPLFFDDFTVGQEFTTPARTVTETDVVTFAGLTGDYNPIHTDAEFARSTRFGERLAHGVLGLSARREDSFPQSDGVCRLPYRLGIVSQVAPRNELLGETTRIAEMLSLALTGKAFYQLRGHHGPAVGHQLIGQRDLARAHDAEVSDNTISGEAVSLKNAGQDADV